MLNGVGALDAYIAGVLEEAPVAVPVGTLPFPIPPQPGASLIGRVTDNSLDQLPDLSFTELMQGAVLPTAALDHLPYQANRGSAVGPMPSAGVASAPAPLPTTFLTLSLEELLGEEALSAPTLSPTPKLNRDDTNTGTLQASSAGVASAPAPLSTTSLEDLFRQELPSAPTLSMPPKERKRKREGGSAGVASAPAPKRQKRESKGPVSEHPVAAEWDDNKNVKGPEEYTTGSGRKVWWQCAKEHSWEARIVDRCSIKNPTGCPECIGYVKGGFREHVSEHPVAADWDYDKNEKEPEDYSCGSNKKVWWKCIQGHSWEAEIRSRCNKKNPSGCPGCSGHVKLGSRGPVSEHRVAAEWDDENNEKGAGEYTCGSDRKVWWKCENGHSWKARILDRCRVKRPSGCPECVGHVKGRPKGSVSEHKTVEEWDYDKNEKEPEDYSCGSNKKVWWKCIEGHSWEARVFDRCNKKIPTGCPNCRRENA